MHILVRRQDRNLQALMVEAFDDMLGKYGETLVGELAAVWRVTGKCRRT